jgi:hypothetical protein
MPLPTPRAAYRILPQVWASYLINGDATGIEESDRLQADEYLTRHQLPTPVSCEPVGFRRRYGNDAAELGGDAELGQDCERYTFWIES